MIYSHTQPINKYKSYTDQLKLIKGQMSDREARISLAKFLRENIGFTYQFMTGIDLHPVQEIILKHMFLRDKGLIVAGRGSGKSIGYIYKSVVSTNDDKLISIPDLIPNLEFKDEEYILDIPPVKLWNGESYQETSKILVQKGKDCMKVKTRCGYFVEGSTNHKIKVFDKKVGDVIWKRYHELDKENDFICISRNNIPENIVPQQDELDEAYLMGILIGDGCITGNNFAVTSMDKEILEFVYPYSTKTIVSDKRTNAKKLILPTTFSRYLAKKYSLNKEKSYTKKIPQEILKNKHTLKYFLRGLFDTDGGIEKKGMTVSFCTVSERLAYQVHLALLTFGIVSKLREKKTKSAFGKVYVITIGSTEALKFFLEIGFNLKRKQDGIKYFLNKKLNSNIDIIPNGIDLIKKSKSCGQYSHDDIGQKFRFRERNNRNYISREFLDEYLDRVDELNISNEYVEKMKCIRHDNFFFDPIDTIEYSKQNCIDFMDIPDGACYWGNGFINHNSFMISIFCTIYPLLYPNTKICIISANFRSARRILEESQKIINGKNAQLLRQCFTSDMKRSQDAWRWRIEENGSQISALPLGNSEGLRGERASVVLVDEGLLIDEHMQKFIIEPFLASKLNYSEQREIIRNENFLMKAGKLNPEDRTIFAPNKYFVLSSASFHFEYLYTLYNKYIEYTQTPLTEMSADVDDEDAKFFRKPEYFVGRFSYKVFQKQSHMDLATIEGVKAEGGDDSDYFKREYMAQFIDIGSSYFNTKKMKECTIKDGEFPCVELKSDKEAKYILSIDPSYSSDEAADFFAMGVFKIDSTNNSICLVHSYARAGCELKQHHEYMAYILSHFNIVFVICDVQGGEIISGFNESKTASDLGINLKFIDVKLNKTFEEDYKEEIRKAKDLYDLGEQRIVYGQTFTGDSIRAMNEHLQNKIDFKKVWFASRLCNNEIAFKKIDGFKMPYRFFDNENNELKLDEFAAWQDDLIQMTKDQTSQIEVKTTAKGTFTFQLPLAVQRSKSKNRPRKDNYTALLLGNWGFKLYNDITAEEEIPEYEFKPFII